MMKLTEALILNPVKLRRSSWENDGFWISSEQPGSLKLEDMLADDWLVEEKTVSISRTDLAELFNKHLAPSFDTNKKFESIIAEMGLV